MPHVGCDQISAVAKPDNTFVLLLEWTCSKSAPCWDPKVSYTKHFLCAWSAGVYDRRKDLTGVNETVKLLERGMTSSVMSSLAMAMQSQADSSTETVQAVNITGSQPQVAAGVLHLTLAPKRRKKTIKWSTDTVDNEECCIFHARRQFGDWSDDNDSDGECQDV